jgi:hypothetical protein
MSIEHCAELVVGYIIPIEDFFEPLLVKRKEGTGFDIAIGEQVFEGPKDDAAWAVFTPDDDVIEAISDLLDCDVKVTGNFYGGGSLDTFVCLTSAKMSYVNKGMSASIKELVKHQDDLERIGEACEELLKVDPGPCGAHVVMFVA